MKKSIYFFFILFGLLTVSSCGSADEGQKCSDKFFSLIIKEKYEQASKLMDTQTLVGVDYVESITSLGNNPTYGKMMKAKKGMGFSTNINNGITTVELPYTLKYENGTTNVQVVIVNRGAGYYISSVQ